MMGRQLRFRVWSNKASKMHYDNFYLYVGGELFQSDELDFMSGTLYEVMQYTGLKDKCSKDIFEGDIIKGQMYWVKSDGYLKKKYPERIDVLCKVIFSEGRFRTKLIKPIEEHKEAYEKNNYRGIEYGLQTLDDDKPLKRIEVIGNVYEDKHLLI